MATNGFCAEGDAIVTKAATMNTTKNAGHDEIQIEDRRRGVINRRIVVAAVLRIVRYLNA